MDWQRIFVRTFSFIPISSSIQSVLFVSALAESIFSSSSVIHMAQWMNVLWIKTTILTAPNSPCHIQRGCLGTILPPLTCGRNQNGRFKGVFRGMRSLCNINMTKLGHVSFVISKTTSWPPNICANLHKTSNFKYFQAVGKWPNQSASFKEKEAGPPVRVQL